MAASSPRSKRALLEESALEYRPCSWQPAADIYRAERNWLIKFDLAGVRPQDIELTLAGRRLTVRGVRRDWCFEEGQQYYALEISYNRFERSVELPCELERLQLSTEYRDGMLLVRLRENC